MRTLRCDCGFEATGERDDELVAPAQNHASLMHGIDLPAELLLALAKASAPDSNEDKTAGVDDDDAAGAPRP